MDGAPLHGIVVWNTCRKVVLELMSGLMIGRRGYLQRQPCVEVAVAAAAEVEEERLLLWDLAAEVGAGAAQLHLWPSDPWEGAEAVVVVQHLFNANHTLLTVADGHPL